MTALITSNDLANSPSPDSPFVYGWRDVRKTHPDGTSYLERIPLTLEDCLHPEMRDVIAESNWHHAICRYLEEAFILKTRNDPTALVLANVGIYWDKLDLGHHAADVAVIFGVREPNRLFSGFDV